MSSGPVVRLGAVAGALLLGGVGLGRLMPAEAEPRQLKVMPPGYNAAIEAEAVAYSRFLTRGLVPAAEGGQPADTTVIGLVQPRPQYVLAALRSPSASDGKPMAVYALVLLRNSTEGYRPVEGFMSCDRVRRGLAVAFPAPGPDVVLVLDARQPATMRFGTPIDTAAREGVQAWLDPRRNAAEPQALVVGETAATKLCPQPSP